MRQWSELDDAERKRILAECVLAVGNRLRGCDVHRGALKIEVKIVDPECTCYEFTNGHQAGCPMQPPPKCSGCAGDPHPGMSDCYRESVVPVHGTPTIEDCVGGR